MTQFVSTSDSRDYVLLVVEGAESAGDVVVSTGLSVSAASALRVRGSDRAERRRSLALVRSAMDSADEVASRRTLRLSASRTILAAAIHRLSVRLARISVAPWSTVARSSGVTGQPLLAACRARWTVLGGACGSVVSKSESSCPLSPSGSPCCSVILHPHCGPSPLPLAGFSLSWYAGKVDTSTVV